MTAKPRPTRSAFLHWMQEAGREVAVMDAVSRGVWWQTFIRSMQKV